MFFFWLSHDLRLNCVNFEHFWIRMLSLLFNNIYSFINIIDNASSIKCTHRVNFTLICIKVLSTKFMIYFLTILIYEVAIMINMLINLGKRRIFTTVLIVVVFKCHDCILVKIHGILYLSQSIR